MYSVSSKVETMSVSPEEKKSKLQSAMIVTGLAFLACAIIGFFDGFAPVPYAVKAVMKTILFLGIPIFYGKKFGDFDLKSLYRPKLETLYMAACFGGLAFVVILGAYYLTLAFVDLTAIVGELDTRMDIDGGNFLFVAVYIAVWNSMLEEFFFRGFLFLRLRKLISGGLAHGISAVMFALYHVAIMLRWFDFWVFAVCMVALIIGGVIFQLLADEHESIIPCWFTHSCANIAINLIGAMLIYGISF